MERRDQFRIISGFLIIAALIISYLAFTPPDHSVEPVTWRPPRLDDEPAVALVDTGGRDLFDTAIPRDMGTQVDSQLLLLVLPALPEETGSAPRSADHPISPTSLLPGGHTIPPSFASRDPDLILRVSRAAAEGRYEDAANLVIRSPDGRRLARENRMSESELRGTLVRGFAYVTRDREIRSPEFEVDRVMSDSRADELIRSVGLDEEDVEILLREHLARKEAYGSAPGNPKPIDYSPREMSPY